MSEEPKSDTPRTDDKVATMATVGITGVVMAEFSRGLERELANEQAKTSAALGILEDEQKKVKASVEWIQKLRNELAEANRRLEVATKFIKDCGDICSGYAWEMSPVVRMVKSNAGAALREMGVAK